MVIIPRMRIAGWTPARSGFSSRTTPAHGAHRISGESGIAHLGPPGKEHATKAFRIGFDGHGSKSNAEHERYDGVTGFMECGFPQCWQVPSHSHYSIGAAPASVAMRQPSAIRRFILARARSAPSRFAVLFSAAAIERLLGTGRAFLSRHVFGRSLAAQLAI